MLGKGPFSIKSTCFLGLKNIYKNKNICIDYNFNNTYKAYIQLVLSNNLYINELYLIMYVKLFV